MSSHDTTKESSNDAGATWHDLTGFKRDCLRLLAEMESSGVKMHGLGLKSRLEDRYSGPINHGRLYPNLDDLVELDLVEKGELDARTNSYRLSPKGHAMLREQKQEWEDLPVKQPAVADGGEE